MESKDDSALFWDVWLSLYPELGLKTLKRIQTRLESGSYELKNVIPVDVLRRHLDTYTENLKDLVTNLDNKSINKNDNKSGTISKASKSKYYRCHHKKYVKKKPSVLKTTKVSRATSPFISSELLENVLIEELFAKNKNLSLDTKVKISETSCKPSNVQFSNSLPTSCNASEHSSETDPSDAESLDVICSSSSSSDSSKKEESPEGSLDTVIVSRKQHLWCEDCNSRLIQLKKQALKTWIPASKNSSKRKECELLSQIEADLHAKSPSSSSCSSSQCDQCEVCGTSLNHLKHQTLVMVQNLEKARSQHKQQQQEQQAMSTGAVKGVCPSPVLSRIPTARTHSSGKNGVMHDNRSGHYRSQRAQNTSQSPRHEKDVVTKPPPHHSIPSDLPPRKDSPFPQAIATEKFQRERRQRHHHHVQQNAWTVVHGQRAAKQQMLNNNALVSGRSTPVKHSNSGKTKLVTNHKMELTHQDYINENGQMMQPDSGYQVVSPRPSLLPVQYHNHHHHHSNMPVANQQETYYHQYQHHQMVGQEQQHHAHNKNSTAVPGQHYSIPVSHHSQQQQPVVLLSPGGSTSSTGSGTAAAVSFFTR